ncbi:lytic transglycosylase domain-containing protein [Polynucleobacter sp.]|jgi:soluble lytic murein transglycosylase-like protein|uniref:lytic transglycosylase domain-containing protein n=1 Tax=Polynucleobacter sp. TaxID=2029855 RepID=UPI0037C5F6E7
MEDAAAAANISPALLKAIVGIESHYNDKAKSRMGAIGLMQLMPQTAASLGLNKESTRDPVANLNAGALHLQKLLNRFSDLEMVIAAYLLGENAFRNQIPQKAMGYVQNILLLYRYFDDPIKPVGVRLEEK